MDRRPLPAAASELIGRLDLAPHPEGGWYRETYRAADEIGRCCLSEDHDGPRSTSTAILYLLTAGDRSRLHRIRSDEVWHHYAGGPLTVHVLEDGGARSIELSGSICPQAVVPAGAWFGATVDAGTDYALVGCTVAPGFDFRDLEIGRRSALLARFPAARAVIERLTDPDA